MTPKEMAEILLAAAPTARGWSEAEVRDLCAKEQVLTVTQPGGFALLQIVPPEAEVLTIAVLPEEQGRGIGTALLTTALGKARVRGATSVYLDVSEANLAARGLYAKLGFAEAGRRKGYYRNANDSRSDALILHLSTKDAILGQHGQD